MTYGHCNMVIWHKQGGVVMYGKSIGLRSQEPAYIIKKIKQGLPVSSFERLRKNLNVSEKLMSQTVNIAIRTLNRRKKEGNLRSDESERIYRIAKLYEFALEVFEDQSIVQKWFREPAKGLGNKTPIEYADTEPGAREVENLLGRIEHGVFS